MTLVSKRWRSTALVAFVVALGVFRVSPAWAATPPANDDFDHATVITTTPFTDSVDTTGATAAGDDPTTCGPANNTIWYSITPAVNETITATATGNFPAVSAYTGPRGALSQVACASGPFSTAHWKVTAGVTYHIMLSNGPPFFSPGNLTLNVTASLPPPNDDFDHATVITTTPFTDTVDTTGATVAADDPTTCGTPANTVWYSFTPAVNEVVTADTGSGFFATSAYTGPRAALSQVACSNGPFNSVRWPVTAGVTYHIMVSSASIGPPFNTTNLTLNVTAALPPPNDDFDHATVITAVPFTATEDVTAATSAPDDPTSCGATSRQSVWFSFTPSVNETVFASASGNGPIFSSAYTGLRGSLTQVGCGSFFTPATWSATAGVTYHIMVASSDGSASSVTLQVSAVIPPPNDDFDHATVVPALPSTTSEAVGGATTAADDPTGCGSTNNSVWFSLTPSITETLIASTIGSNYQTAVSVYTGSRGALTRVACQNGPFQAPVRWTGTAGVTYHIMVANLFDGANASGQLTLNLSGALPPPNDDFGHATVVSSLPFTDSIDASGATSAPDDPTNCGTTDSSVWYDLTPTVNEQITADTTGSNYVPIVSAYTGSRGSLSPVACGAAFSAITSFPATAGVTYHIMVANSPFFGTAGHLALTLQGAQAPVITKTFGASSIPVNATTSLTFAVTNPNPTSALTGIGFGDSLPAGMVISTPNGLSGSCGGGQIQAPEGTGFVALSGATLAGGASCTFSLIVTATTAGVDVNSVTVNSTNGGTGNTSTASLTVIGPPFIAKQFGAPSIPFGGTTTLSFGLANPNTTLTLNGVGFTDTLPAGLVVSTPNGLSGSCGGGSITAAAGSGSVTVSNVTLAEGASCVFSINVTATRVGTDNNTTSVVTSANAGTGPPATATLTVVQAPTVTTLTASSASTALAAPVSFTATVGPSGPNATGIVPTGTVSFFLDGNSTPTATIALSGTTASFATSSLGAGPHTVVARYSGDANFAPSSSTSQTTVTVTCTTTLTGNHAGLVLRPGSTCVLNGRLAGSVVVPRGAQLDLEGSSVAGSISASGASFVRICGTSASAVTIGGSTGLVLVGDGGDDGCAPNTLRGSLVLNRNTGGVEALGNHVRGGVVASGNSGSGPFPEDTAPEIGTDTPQPITASARPAMERFWLR